MSDKASAPLPEGDRIVVSGGKYDALMGATVTLIMDTGVKTENIRLDAISKVHANVPWPHSKADTTPSPTPPKADVKQTPVVSHAPLRKGDRIVVSGGKYDALMGQVVKVAAKTCTLIMDTGVVTGYIRFDAIRKVHANVPWPANSMADTTPSPNLPKAVMKPTPVVSHAPLRRATELSSRAASTTL